MLNSEYVADVLDISDLTSGIFDDEINKGGASPINILQKQIQDFEINISEMERLIDDEYELQGEFPKYLPRVSSKKSSGSLLTWKKKDTSAPTLSKESSWPEIEQLRGRDFGGNTGKLGQILKDIGAITKKDEKQT